MRAEMEITMDTLWANQVRLSVVCEFDNPHRVTTPRLAELMVARLRVMVEEVQHADERALPDFEPVLRPGRDASAEREREASELLQRERGQGSIFAERKDRIVG